MSSSTRMRIIIVVILFMGGCTYNEVPKSFFDCNSSTLAVEVVSKLDVTTCLAIDGSITVAATGGIVPYAFNINGGSYQSDGTFKNLGPGSYTLYAKDANHCEKWIQVDIVAPNSTLAVAVSTTPDNQCSNGNGSITLTASGGTPPYTYQFGTGQVGNQSSFSNLKSGPYAFTVRDNLRCPIIVNVLVHHGDTGTSFASSIKPILNDNCATSGCHNGDNGAPFNWTVFTNVQNSAVNIKTRTGNKSMPPAGSGTLSQGQIDLIACWVDDGAKNN